MVIKIYTTHENDKFHWQALLDAGLTLRAAPEIKKIQFKRKRNLYLTRL